MDKSCSKCGEVKSVSEFYTSGRAKDGYSSWCKECQKRVAREYYWKHKQERPDYPCAEADCENLVKTNGVRCGSCRAKHSWANPDIRQKRIEADRRRGLRQREQNEYTRQLCCTLLYEKLLEKECCKCGETKRLYEFPKDGKCRDGHSPWCRVCRRLATIEYRLKYRDEILERQRKYSREYREEINEKRRRYRDKNREKVNARKRKWYHKNRETILARRQKKADKLKRYAKAYRQTSRYKELHREAKIRRRAREYNADGVYKEEEFNALVAFYGNICLGCGKSFSAGTIPTPDHIIPLAKGGSNWPTNIQPLCARCNSSKRTKIIDYRGDLRLFREIDYIK